MGTASAVTTAKRTTRLMAAFSVVLGVVFLWLATLPDGGFVKGLFQGGGGALIALAAFSFVLSFRRPNPGDTTGMWRPSLGRRTDDS